MRRILDVRYKNVNLNKIMSHVDESTNSIYDMILGRDLITPLGLDLKFYDNVIIGGELP